ncbi:hypothetical protein [Ferribacterium limneticum]|uniref:hypothetical protein n=1 Tax=Ferribacterium limneticum TaxID=76259 RepID=UPI001CFAC74C|nr:hypothetical protein [Ferribacterium limneticum]UCV17858.1 hypothetical protein KI610_13665 [Ferribacterium limneticum]
MLNQNLPPRVSAPTPVGPVFSAIFPALTIPSRHQPAAIPDRATLDEIFNDTKGTVEWSEEDIVFLHWRLLVEVSCLADPATPLEEKFDTLCWVFSEREKDALPFSFVSCLRVVGCSPLSPIAYCGRVDAEEIRDHIRHSLKAWLNASLERFPDWVSEAIIHNPTWVASRLSRNPQWINEQIKRMSVQGDLFA